MADVPPPAPPPADRPPPRRRRTVAKLAATAVAAAATTGVGLGLNNPQALDNVVSGGAACGGSERWDVKVGNDADVTRVQAATPISTTIQALNQVQPEAVEDGHRMTPELKTYRITGYLAFFKQESGAGDQDYHVVITDTPTAGAFNQAHEDPTGHSMVVEIPNPSCFAGKSGSGRATSLFGQQIASVRAGFEKATGFMDGRNIPAGSVPVTVTGVAFFDRSHGQVGRSLERAIPGGQSVVLELHPVLDFAFNKAPGA